MCIPWIEQDYSLSGLNVESLVIGLSEQTALLLVNASLMMLRLTIRISFIVDSIACGTHIGMYM